MAAIVDIVGRHGIRTEVCHRNQCNMSKLVLYKPLLHFYSELYINNRTEHFSYKGGCGMRGYVCVDAFERRAGLGYRLTASGY